MAYSDNYPNGYKSGYDSWDDPDRKDYSPSGWDRAQRNAMYESSERDRVMSDYEAGLERQRRNQERRQAERDREEFARKNQENIYREKAENRDKVFNYILKQERDKFDNMKLFPKAILKLSGKFYTQRNQLHDKVDERVSKMTDFQIENFIENNIESGARKR